jgi:hypothetical protein
VAVGAGLFLFGLGLFWLIAHRAHRKSEARVRVKNDERE